MKGDQTEKEGYCIVFPPELGPLLRKHIVKRTRVLRQEEWEIRNGEGGVEEMTRVLLAWTKLAKGKSTCCTINVCFKRTLVAGRVDAQMVMVSRY